MSAHQEVTEALEGMVDAMGLQRVLELLGTICAEKAEHIRENWQDKHTAAAWDQAAVRVHQCSVMEAVKFVSPKAGGR